MNAFPAYRACLALLFAAGAAGAHAQNVAQVLRDAQGNDATFAAARFALDAGREKLPQGRALMLPSLNLTANVTEQRFELDSRNVAVSPSVVRRPGSYGYTLSFSQPLYRPQNTLARDQAEFQVRQSEAVFGQARQDLIVRVAQAYFDILASIDTLGLVRAQKAAISEQLAQAKRNFEVGTATITDTHEAQARYDLILAQEIAAQNDLENKERALQQITGKEYKALKPLRPDVQLSGPNPATMQAWVDLAKTQGYPVRIQGAVTTIAGLEAQRAKAGHRPTLDLVASHGQTGQNASTVSSVGSDTTSSSISLQFALPLYQGGAINSREREAAANAQKSKQDLEVARRAAALSAQQSYLAVSNGIAQVKALEQALVSSQSALASNKLGYEVGVRINIDVLNAQQQLFSTRRDLALARYNTITNHLKLKAAAGSLTDGDLEEVNRALAP